MRSAERNQNKQRMKILMIVQRAFLTVQVKNLVKPNEEVSLTHHCGDMFFCNVISKQLHQFLP